MKVMVLLIPSDVGLPERRKLARNIGRALHTTNVTMLPPEQWPDVAELLVPAHTEMQQFALRRMGFTEAGE